MYFYVTDFSYTIYDFIVNKEGKAALHCVCMSFPHKVSMTRILFYMQNTGRDILLFSEKQISEFC